MRTVFLVDRYTTFRAAFESRDDAEIFCELNNIETDPIEVPYFTETADMRLATEEVK